MAKEYIERDALIELANNHVDGVIDANDIAWFPTADVVEVVRCKDCKHYIKAMSLCTHQYCVVDVCDKMDFCSYGERWMLDGNKENL